MPNVRRRTLHPAGRLTAGLTAVLLGVADCTGEPGAGNPQSDGGVHGQQGERGRQGERWAAAAPAAPATPHPDADDPQHGTTEHGTTEHGTAQDGSAEPGVSPGAVPVPGTSPGSTTTPGGHRASGPLGARTRARFELVSAAAQVTVRNGDLGSDLYRISTPDDSGLTPAVTDAGHSVRLALARTGRLGHDTVDIQLNQRVRWEIRLGASAGEQRLDLAAGPVSGVVLAAGAAYVQLRLPRPTGTVPVRVSGGAGRLDVRAPAGVPVQVRLANGAGTVAVDGTTRFGIGGGTVLTPDGWQQATDRYAVEALAGVAALSVDR